MLDNLSLGGALVKTSTPMAAKAKVDLVIALDGVREIELRARVIYARKSDGYQTECGLRFIELSYDRYKTLIAYINDREKAMTIGVQHPRASRLA